MRTFDVRLRLYNEGSDVVGWMSGIQKVRIPNAMNTLTFQLAKDIRDTARRYVRERSRWKPTTGRLAASIIAIPAPSGRYKASYTVAAYTNYAKAVELGTKPHEIPNNPFWGLAGKKHPGSKPMWFMSDAFDREMTLLNKLINMHFNVGGWS